MNQNIKNGGQTDGQNKKMEPNTITYKGKVIATHTYDKTTGWNVKLKEELSYEEKEGYKKIIEKMAKENEVKLWIK